MTTVVKEEDWGVAVASGSAEVSNIVIIPSYSFLLLSKR